LDPGFGCQWHLQHRANVRKSVRHNLQTGGRDCFTGLLMRLRSFAYYTDQVQVLSSRNTVKLPPQLHLGLNSTYISSRPPLGAKTLRSRHRCRTQRDHYVRLRRGLDIEGKAIQAVASPRIIPPNHPQVRLL
jgi:hypothetical protein